MEDKYNIQAIRDFLEENKKKKLEIENILGGNDITIIVGSDGEQHKVNLQLLVEKIVENKLEDLGYKNKFKWNLQLFGDSDIVPYDFDQYSISNNIKEYMNKKRITQEELAEMMGISRSTVVSMINNKGISLENAYRLSIILDVSITDLFKYSKE